MYVLKSEALGSNQTNGDVVVDTATVHLFGHSADRIILIYC